MSSVATRKVDIREFVFALSEEEAVAMRQLLFDHTSPDSDLWPLLNQLVTALMAKP